MACASEPQDGLQLEYGIDVAGQQVEVSMPTSHTVDMADSNYDIEIAN